ncbi:AIPR family protein [Hymenobacter pini]|uniref:AIPR family protein n=1 Tax=Hymenobacter pini TaxID=2880879 RepID=UPI001CF0EA5B|nr:AIPR family protein [Hymenobacter pini]MCA8830923.1 AIPR family protein [Hymenobacter pini]
MSNTKIILEGCIEQYKHDNEIELSSVNIFEVFSSAQTLKIYNLSYDEIVSTIVGSGSDGGVDCFASFVNGEYVRSFDEIASIKFQGNGVLDVYIAQYKKENSFKEGALDKLITTMPIVFELDKDQSYLLERFNADLVDKILIIRELWKKTIANGGEIKFHYSYASVADEIKINKAFYRKIEQLVEVTKLKTKSSYVEFKLIDAQALLDLFQKKKSVLLPLTFKEQPASTKYDKNGGVGYVGIVKLEDYYKFITDDNKMIREELFESNIRHYRGEVDVNNRIKESLDSELDRDFWWLNNGITIIADKVNQVEKDLHLVNVQIVNGLQTSYTIGRFYKIGIDPRSVLVKIIVSQDKETIDKIIASTNSQNPVSPDLLRATEQIQREIEMYFLNKGYFYDRRRNFYSNIGKPSKRIFSIQYTAQSIESILLEGAHNAKSRPNALTKETTRYRKIFDKNVDFNAYLNSCLIVQKTFDNWLEMDESVDKEKTLNFKLHLARVVTSVVLGKGGYKAKDVADMDLKKYTKNKFDKSVKIFIKILNEYQRQFPKDNILNIGKNKAFSSLISEYMKKQYAPSYTPKTVTKSVRNNRKKGS